VCSVKITFKHDNKYDLQLSDRRRRPFVIAGSKQGILMFEAFGNATLVSARPCRVAPKPKGAGNKSLDNRNTRPKHGRFPIGVFISALN
jgi:hypothetical protein